MYLNRELPWNVVVPAKQLHSEGLLLQEAIILQLLEDFSDHKATSEYGYFVAPTSLERIGDGKVRQDSGDVLFPVVFNCITFKPFREEILCGIVTKIVKRGALLSCGPIKKKVYLSATKMGDYHHFPGKNPVFQNDKDSKIEKYVLVRFKVLDTRWDETQREFHMLGSLEGDNLGPIHSGESSF
ncbi:hypothetical protein MKX03_005020 [Papaver bracteatum]|nr:hypothetical protein MKX03_005020 [Papaver bracteatum]